MWLSPQSSESKQTAEEGRGRATEQSQGCCSDGFQACVVADGATGISKSPVFRASPSLGHFRLPLTTFHPKNLAFVPKFFSVYPSFARLLKFQFCSTPEGGGSAALLGAADPPEGALAGKKVLLDGTPEEGKQGEGSGLRNSLHATGEHHSSEFQPRSLQILPSKERKCQGYRQAKGWFSVANGHGAALHFFKKKKQGRKALPLWG